VNTLILGLGNDLRGDDAIGFKIVDYIEQQKQYPGNISIANLPAAGLNLISYVSRYERVFIVDSVEVSDKQVGSFWKLDPLELAKIDLPVRISHGVGIHTVLDVTQRIGFSNPRQVKFFLVGIRREKNIYTPYISEEISTELKEKIPFISQEIIKELTF